MYSAAVIICSTPKAPLVVLWSRASRLGPATGTAVAAPSKRSCRNVLNFEIPVGCTSALGREKSQYRVKLFGGGNDAYL